MRVMVVDDSEIIRMKVSEVLASENYEIVGSAKNGLEALEQFKLLKPAVMTLDITMPMMDGIETIRKIMETDSDVRILVISALADKTTLLKAMSLGAYGFLCKPFTDDNLADAIEELVEDLV